MERVANLAPGGLPNGEDAPLTVNDNPATQVELDDWIRRLADFAHLDNFPGLSDGAPRSVPIQESLLPASFAVASYRASLLPLLGDPSEANLQGPTADFARLPVRFEAIDEMVALDDPHVAAISRATLSLNLPRPTDTESETQDE
jgi:hypothetical protein